MLESATRIPLNRRIIIITVSLVTTREIIIESSLPVIHSTVLNTVPIGRWPLIRIRRRRLMRIVMLSDWRLRRERSARSAQILIRVRGRDNRRSNRRRNSMKIAVLRRMIIDRMVYYGLSSVWVVDDLRARCC